MYTQKYKWQKKKKTLIGHKCNKGQEEIKIRMMSQKTKTNIPKFYYLL